MTKSTLAVWIGFFAGACGGVRAAEAPPTAHATAAADQSNEPAPPMEAELSKSALAESAPVTTAALPEAPAAPPVAGGGASQPAANATSVEAPAVAREMLDIQASLQIKVDNLEQSMRAIHALARKHAGTVTDERLNAQGGGTSEASLTLRVPSGASDVFFEELRRLGEVLSQQISARDIGKEFHDAGILLRNLEVTMKRYEEILQRANTVQEILHIESELARLRGEIERVKGNLRWLADRAARATVQISLRTDQPQPRIVAVEPKAHFYPGARLTYLGDHRGDDGGAGYFGGGLSLRFSRGLSFDLDGLRDVDSGTRGLDLLLVTVGGELYSEFLGDGKRRFLNPYLGLRAGYARFLGENEAVAGATLGLELLKTDFLSIDADLRLLGFFLGEPGAHGAVQPTLGANVAF
jgi:hypothetical protein